MLYGLGKNREGVRSSYKSIIPWDLFICVTLAIEISYSICAYFEWTFLPKMRIFSKIFEILLHTTPQKSLFIAFLLTNFPKISKKVLKNFSRRLRRRKREEITQFFRSEYGEITPPPFEGSPPNISDRNELINWKNIFWIGTYKG